MSARIRPLVTVILDGWGVSLEKNGNAIAAAATPNMDTLLTYYPSATLAAAGEEVGLPWGEAGNSETGHKNIGAGSVQYQIVEGINHAIADRSFFANPVLLEACAHVKQNSSQLHLMGLVSVGGVHSALGHLIALLELAASQGLAEQVFIHMFSDGRDSPPQAALAYLAQLEQAITRFNVGNVASVTGRFYAMDRNNNWERTQATYDMLTGGPRGSGAPNAHKAIENAYAKDIFDENIPPTAITWGGAPITEIRDNDTVIFFNFRPDRARQLTAAFVQPEAVPFPTKQFQNLLFVTLAQYDPNLPAMAAYTEAAAEWPLARVLSEAGLKQIHIAETEKYAHITYYLNAGHEKPFPGEEHALIESAHIVDFAQQPQMGAQAITDRAIQEIELGVYDVLFLNYANPDMVGHTGNFEATVAACTFVDECIGRLAHAVQEAGGAMIVTADHGNAEEKLNQATGEASTDHTANPVPFHLMIENLRRTTPKSEAEIHDILSAPIGVLADVAPTIVELLQLPRPTQMTGVSLLNSLR